MMRSLYSGVAGLRTHQTKMDVLGNNIANVNTTSFKSQSITFSDLMYQTTQAASGATETKGGVNARQIGLGAKSGAIGTAIESQGATQTTNNPFDIMITGKAFFVVNNGKENLFTRDGSFYVDGAGNLAMQSNGYFVMGWNATEDPDTGEITVNKNGELSNLQIMSPENATYSPASTTSALVSGNIDDNDPNVVSDDGKTITLEFYDNKGYLYTGKFNIKDTGEDHLFSVELTEIIDSNGVKFTTEQMEGISFGNIQDSKDYKDFSDGYYIEKTGTDPTTGVELGKISIESGQTVFEGVPGKGDSITTLSDISGFLEKVYPTANLKRYANIDSYEITTDSLNVTFNYTDYSSSINSATYKSAAVDNKDFWYYDPATQFGYAAPSSEGGKLSQLNTEMLDKVFKLNSSSADAVVRKALDLGLGKFNYTFDGDNLSIIASTVPEAVSEPQSVASKLKQKYDDYFVMADGSSTKISEYAATVASIDADGDGNKDYPEGAYYKYNDVTGVLTIYGATTNSTPASKGVDHPITDTPSLYNLMKQKAENGPFTKNISAITDATALARLQTIAQGLSLDKDDLTKVDYTFNATSKTYSLTITDGHGATGNFELKSTDTTNSKLYDFLTQNTSLTLDADTELNANAINELKALITEDKFDVTSVDFTLRDLTGTSGFTTTVNYEIKTVIATDALTTFNVLKTDLPADTNTYEYDVPTVVFRDTATRKTGYVLRDDDPEGFTLDEIPDNILTEIYGVSRAEIKKYNMGKYEDFTDDFSSMLDEEFNVTFQNGGKITVTHVQPDEVPIDSYRYAAKVENDGTVTYTTNGDVVVFPTDYPETESFPLEGYISDALATADSKIKGLLEKAFGITDADARAYGSEGYYVIDENQGIKLYTSKADKSRANKTIQLVFDAATGNLVSANKNETTKKVDLIFDQNATGLGLEAFGFQETPGSERTIGSIEIDFSSVTNYNTNGSSTIKSVKGDKKSLNTGRAVGEMNGVTVSTDGTIYATYSNGQTKLLGQIASAEFANASGLAKEGDNLYSQTLNSGEATIQDITTDGGYMNTGVLEMSNVDLSKEFTEMITTQRGFQANSRIITVSDTLLEELTNLKR